MNEARTLYQFPKVLELAHGTPVLMRREKAKDSSVRTVYQCPTDQNERTARSREYRTPGSATEARTLYQFPKVLELARGT